MFTIPYVTCVTCHVSRVTCHMSHVTCQVSQKKKKKKMEKSGGASRLRVCYQRGLPRLVLTRPRHKSPVTRPCRMYKRCDQTCHISHVTGPCHTSHDALLRWTFALRTYVRMRTFPVKWFPLCPHLKKKGRIAQLDHWPEVLLLTLAVALHWRRSNTNN